MIRPYTNKIVVHHTVTPQNWGKVRSMGAIYQAHASNGLIPGGMISYHYVIGKNWKAPGRTLGTVGWHAGNWPVNLTSVAVALCGNFEKDYLTKYQKKELARILQDWQARFHVKRKNILLHRDVHATACPGQHVTQGLINILFETIINRKPLPPQHRTPLPRQR